MTPRLKVQEQKQHGQRTGGPTTTTRTKRRRHLEQQKAHASRADRASRSRAAAQTLAGRTPPALLSPSSKASLATKHVALQQLPKKERPKALKSLCKEFSCSRSYPARLSKKMLERKKLPMHQGKGAGQTKSMTPSKIEEVMGHLKEHCYDLSFEQLAELSSVSASILCRFFRRQPGWRQVGKSTRPLLDDHHVKARAAWATANLNNKWRDHVDLDEKWFYVISNRGRLKLPPGVEKPRTRVKSKRFVAKIMVLTAVARPAMRHGFNGMVCCWRVTEKFTYKRRSTYQGVEYQAGESRDKDCTMDGDKFAEMLKELVFPAIRDKMFFAKTVTLQWDNAGGHGMSSIDAKIADDLPSPAPGVPAMKVVPQCAQSPDTNVCDLGFFNSVDSRLPKLRPYDLDAFFALVEEAHAEYPAEKLDSLYDSKMRICKAILSANPPGNNDYKMPHHGDV